MFIEWIDGWLDERIDGWIDEWTDCWLDGCNSDFKVLFQIQVFDKLECISPSSSVIYYVVDHIYVSGPPDYNGCEKFLSPSDIAAIIALQGNALLTHLW